MKTLFQLALSAVVVAGCLVTSAIHEFSGCSHESCRNDLEEGLDPFARP
jgi:hypothetical protein